MRAAPAPLLSELIASVENRLRRLSDLRAV